jgi:prophage DNA circulation protein
MNFFKKIGRGAGNFFHKVEHGAGNFFTKTVPNIAHKVGGGLEQATNIANNVIGKVSNAIEKVAPIASTIASVTGFPEVGAAINMGTGMLKNASSMINNANNTAQGVLGNVSNVSQGLGGNVGQISNVIRQAIPGGGGGMVFSGK